MNPSLHGLNGPRSSSRHGSIAYLLYLDRTIASHSLATTSISNSSRGDIPVAQTPLFPSYHAPGPGSPVPGPEKSLPPVPVIPVMSATYRATCQSTPSDPPILSGAIDTCGVGPHMPHAGTSRDETIRQLHIQNSVLQKQFKSLFTPSLHVALDRVRINSRGVPLSKYPLSERIRDTLAIATLPIGYYDYVLLQLSELTVFRRHTWLRQGYLATAAQDASAIEGIILKAQENLLHNTPPTLGALRASAEPATLYVGRSKSRWSVINPPSLRTIKAPCTPNKATKASTTIRSVVLCTPVPESVRRIASKRRLFGCSSTRTNGWLATQASQKGAPVHQETSTTNPVRNLRTVTEIHPSQVATAGRRVTDNPRPNPSKRALQRLRRTQVRKHYERLHNRGHSGHSYRTGEPLSDPSRAVVVYTRLLAHNRSRRQSVVDKDEEAEVVGFDRCINVPVVNVSTVYGHIYYAYYVAKRDEYSRVP